MLRIGQFYRLIKPKMRFLQYPIAAFLMAVLFLQCEDNKNQPDNTEPDKLRIASSESDNGMFQVELFANDSLFAGYNPIYLRLSEPDSKAEITAAEISLKPLMHMVKMTHAAPFENPSNLANEEQFFEGAVVFIMPSNPDEGWSLEVDIEAQGKTDHVSLTLPKVIEPEEARLVRILDAESGTTYFLSLVQPTAPMVGKNPLEFTLHYRENMHSFPAVENAKLTFEPEMPSMNHGSPNNEQPEHSETGHYKGVVNFTMTGWWRLNVMLEANGKVISDEIDFDVTF